MESSRRLDSCTLASRNNAVNVINSSRPREIGSACATHAYAMCSTPYDNPYEGIRRANRSEKPRRSQETIADVRRDATHSQNKPGPILQTKSPSLEEEVANRCHGERTANSCIPAIEFCCFCSPCLSSGARMQGRTLLYREALKLHVSVFAASLLCDELSSSPATLHARKATHT